MIRLVRQLASLVALVTFVAASPWTNLRPASLSGQSSHSEEERSENDEECGATVKVERLSLTERKSGDRGHRRLERIPPVTNLRALRSGTNATWTLAHHDRWHPALVLQQLLPRRLAFEGDGGSASVRSSV